MSSIFPFDWLNLLAWSLVHFLWQGTLIGLVAWLLNSGFLRRNTHACYVTNVAMLVLLVACVPLTMLYSTSTRLEESGLQSSVILIDGANSSSMRLDNQPLASAPASKPSVVTAPSRSVADTAKPTLFPAIVLGAYVAGLLIMLLRFAVAAAETMRLRRSATLIHLEHLCDMTRAQAKAIGLRTVPLIATCDELVTPIVIGLFRPMILLPATLLSNIGTSELEAVFAHELAHIRRYDLWLNVFQKLAESLLFFHPAVWYINHIIDTSRELCCDEMVVRTGHRPLEYASALLRIAEIAERAIGNRSEHALALSAAGKRSSGFKQRVMRLISGTTAIKTNISEMLCLGLVLAAAFYFALGIVVSRDALAAEQAKPQGSTATAESKEATQDAGTQENLPKTPEEWKVYHAENKRKSIEAYHAHPFSKLLDAYIAQPKKEFQASVKFQWKGDRKPIWETFDFSTTNNAPDNIGLQYTTDGALRMDLDYKKGTMQTCDNLREKSFWVFLPKKTTPVAISPRGTPQLPNGRNDGNYLYADIVNDAKCEWMRGGATRFASNFWPFALHWLHNNLSEGAGEIKTFDPVEGQPNVYSVTLTFPPKSAYRFKIDGDQLQLVSIISTEQGYYGTQTREFENEMIDGVPMPTHMRETFTKPDQVDEFLWNLDYSGWGGSKPFEAELEIPVGAYVNDQPAQKYYLQEANTK